MNISQPSFNFVNVVNVSQPLRYSEHCERPSAPIVLLFNFVSVVNFVNVPQQLLYRLLSNFVNFVT